MGNNQSLPEDHQSQHGRSHSQSGNNKSSASPTAQTPRKDSPHPSGPSRIPASLPIASPVATSTSNTHAHATVSQSPVSVTTRARSSTTSAVQPPSTIEGGLVQKSDDIGMGAAESRPERVSTITTINPVDTPPKQTSPPPTTTTTTTATKPVDVPIHTQQISNDVSDQTIISSSLTHADYSLVPSDYSRPPRLPLPIEEEVHSPGSPIITPQDLSSVLSAGGHEGVLPRRTSVLSSTTVDDEELADNEGLEPTTQSTTVPTKIEWIGPGEKIYVTGTFVNWERKFKLYPNQDRTSFSATLQLKPGTHHVKFLVDGDMITSEELPTTVDYTNILVNYIEVVAPLPGQTTRTPVPAKPMPIPGAAQSQEKSSGAHGVGDSKQTAGVDATLPTSQQKAATARPTTAQTSQQAQTAKPAAPPRQRKPRPKYTNRLPEYLHDLDLFTNPEDERFQRSNRVIMHLPQPPSLPMFMSKSILNGTTPHKDDASVLIMPNHTVLNHLATSSIKLGVLATSGTTRYKRKFLTTIMYKSTSDDG